jgi:ribose transport system permease protein
MWSRLLSDYGMVLVLLVVCAYFSVATYAEQHPTGAAAGEALAAEIAGHTDGVVLIVVRNTDDGRAFAAALERALTAAGRRVAGTVVGEPADARRALQDLAATGTHLAAIAATQEAGAWPALEGAAPIFVPHSYYWPNFLKASNLLNVADQISFTAILAIGMTLVIITGGIDLSVGSIVALAAVLAARFIRDFGGAEAASAEQMLVCSLAAIALAGLVGLVNGILITTFALPPFIVTLGMMLVASGLAFECSAGQTIYQVPAELTQLARGSSVAGLPNAVVLMAGLYVAAHVLMSQTVLGRHIYAVGGNAEAARLSGVPVQRVVVLVYIISGLFAGLVGVLMASQLKGGDPKFGKDYELYVIAAAVVGGTSLSGGEGKVFGTLIGALLIAVIQNGMNLVGVSSYRQRVVLGAIIIGAVLLDRAKQHGWRWYRRPE